MEDLREVAPVSVLPLVVGSIGTQAESLSSESVLG